MNDTVPPANDGGVPNDSTQAAVANAAQEADATNATQAADVEQRRKAAFYDQPDYDDLANVYYEPHIDERGNEWGPQLIDVDLAILAALTAIGKSIERLASVAMVAHGLIESDTNPGEAR